MRKPSASGERRHAIEMLPGQNFRRRHHRRLPAGLDHFGHGEKRHDRLARADVALQQPDHALVGPEVGADVLERLALRAGQRKRQGRLEPAGKRAFGNVGAPDRLAHPRANEEQGELVRKQFVKGETGRCAARRVDVLGRLRPVHRLERFGEGRQLQAFDGVGCDPFRQPRQALQRAVRGARHDSLEKTFGQRIDRLDRRQAGEFLGVQNPVGMNDLPDAVVELEPAGNPAGRADRQASAHPFGIRQEEHQFDVAGVVFDQDLERRLRAEALRRAMLHDFRLERDDRAGNGVADFRPRAPVERRIGQVEQHVENARALRSIEQAVEQFGVLGSDPGKRGSRGEQRIEERRAHDGVIAIPGPSQTSEGLAFLNLSEGAAGATTLESKTNFVGAARVGATLTGVCAVVHRGRRTQVVQTRVETEEARLVALVVQTQMTL